MRRNYYFLHYRKVVSYRQRHRSDPCRCIRIPELAYLVSIDLGERETLQLDVRRALSKQRRLRFSFIDLSHSHRSPSGVAFSTSANAALPKHMFSFDATELNRRVSTGDGSLPIGHRASTAIGSWKP